MESHTTRQSTTQECRIIRGLALPHRASSPREALPSARAALLLGGPARGVRLRTAKETSATCASTTPSVKRPASPRSTRRSRPCATRPASSSTCARRPTGATRPSRAGCSAGSRTLSFPTSATSYPPRSAARAPYGVAPYGVAHHAAVHYAGVPQHPRPGPAPPGGFAEGSGALGSCGTFAMAVWRAVCDSVRRLRTGSPPLGPPAQPVVHEG